MKVLARIAFSWKVDDTDYSDPGSVVEALRRASYTVRHMSHDYGTHGTDCVEAIIDACADGAVPLPLGVASLPLDEFAQGEAEGVWPQRRWDKIMDAIYYEVQSIAHRNGGLCHEILTLDQKDYIQFEYPLEGKSFFDLHIS